jgi:hypothetical protein
MIMTSKGHDVKQRKTHLPKFRYNYYFSFEKHQQKIPLQSFLISTLVLLCHPVSSMLDDVTADTLSQNMIKNMNTSGFSISNTSSIESNTPISKVMKCPDLIDVDPGSTAYNSSSIECIQKLLNSCTASSFLMLYGLGSLDVSIKGQNEDKNNSNRCLIELNQETEMGEGKPYSCSIPMDKIVGWKSWMDANGLKALDDLSPFCQKIMSIN